MKRNMVLIKKILELMETIKPGSQANEDSFTEYLGHEKEYERDIIYAHVELLIEENFIVGKINMDYPGNQGRYGSMSISKITWKGHDLLESLR